MTKNVRIMLALLLIGFCYTFVCGNGGCDDTGEITVSVEGKVEDWSITGLDSAVGNVADPVLDLGDAVVDTARDTLEDAVEWGFDSTTGGQ